MQEKRKTLLDKLAYSGLMGLNEDNNIHYVFDPNSNSFINVKWNSPFDNVSNIFNMALLPNTKEFITIRDKH